MTLHAIEWVTVIAAGALVLAATRLDRSPWWILGLASVATVATFVLAVHVSGDTCAGSALTGAARRFLGFLITLNLALYAAAALAGIVDGIRLRMAGDRDTAASRAVGIPILSAIGVGVVFVAALYSIGPCLG
jgi:peptidoglycan/LPS O-acetylase OafA/YrhL